MKRTIAAEVVMILIVPLLSAQAVDIQVGNWGNLDTQQQAVVNTKIALWEARLPVFGPPDQVVSLEFNMQDLGLLRYPEVLPDAEYAITLQGDTLALTDNMQYDTYGRPISARIRLTTNPAITWYFGLNPPVPAGEYDFYTVVNHEMCHALGFTVVSRRFDDNLRTNGDGSRTYNPNLLPGEPTATLTPIDRATHLSPDVHPGDLMIPSTSPGERRTPSILDENIIKHNVWAKGKTSGGSKVDTQVKEKFKIHQNKLDLATDLHFRVWQKEDNIDVNGWVVTVTGFENVDGNRDAQPDPAHNRLDNISGVPATSNPDNGKHAVKIDCKGGSIPRCNWVEIEASLWLTSWNTKCLADVEWTNSLLQNLGVVSHGWTIGFPRDEGGGEFTHNFTLTNDSAVDTIIITGLGLWATFDAYAELDSAAQLIPILVESAVLLPGEVLDIPVLTSGDMHGGFIYGKFDIDDGASLASYFTDLFQHPIVPPLMLPGCPYVIGDINNNGSANGIDVVYGVNYFKGGLPPPVSCDCPPHGTLFAAGDVNGNCAFNGIDVSYFVNYLKGAVPALLYCPACPPASVR